MYGHVHGPPSSQKAKAKVGFCWVRVSVSFLLTRLLNSDLPVRFPALSVVAIPRARNPGSLPHTIIHHAFRTHVRKCSEFFSPNITLNNPNSQLHHSPTAPTPVVITTSTPQRRQHITSFLRVGVLFKSPAPRGLRLRRFSWIRHCSRCRRLYFSFFPFSSAFFFSSRS